MRDEIARLTRERDEARAAYRHCGGFIQEPDGTRWWSADLLAKVERERDEARRKVRDHHLEACESCAATESDVIALRALLREVEWVYDDSGCYYCATALSAGSSDKRCHGMADKRDGVIVVLDPHAPDCRLKAALEGRE